MPVFNQYPTAKLPLVGNEVTILAQDGQTVNAPVNAIAAGVLPAVPAPLLGSSGGAFTTIQPDNITITISDGVISANKPPNSPLLGGTGTNYSTVFPDGVTLQIQTNKLSAITNASNALLGLDSLGQAPLSTMKSVALQAGTQGESNVLVGPASGGSGPASWRQLTASDVSGVAAIPASTPLLGSNGTSLQAVSPDNATLQVSGGTISAKTNVAGGVAGLDAQGTISGQTATATGSTTARALGAITADSFNVLNFGVTPGVPGDCSVGINAAIVAANARVQSGLAPSCRVVIPNIGYTYSIANPIQRLPGVEIEGWGCPLIQLAPNSNCAIIEDAYFQTLVNSSTTGVPAALVNGAYDGVIRNLRLDGNVTNQNTYAAAITAGTFNYQCGIMSCGSNPRFERVFITNMVGHGIRTTLVINNNALPNYNFNPGCFHDINVSGTGGHSWLHAGPHDSHIDGATLITPSLAGTGLYSGLFHGPDPETSPVGSGGALVLHDVHTWSIGIYTAGVPMNAYGAEFHAQQVNGFGCNFEGGQQSVLIQTNAVSLNNCQFYDCGNGNNTPMTAGVAMVNIYGSGNVLKGCRWNALVHGSNSNANDVFAVSFGNATVGTSGGNVIDGSFQQFYTRTPFDFSYDGGTNLITGIGWTPGNNTGVTAFPHAPNEAAGTCVTYAQSSTKFAYRTGMGYLYANIVNFANAASGTSPSITTAGSTDNNTGLAIHTQGNSATFISNDNGTQAQIGPGVASTVNCLGISGAATGSGPSLTVHGSDTNISINYTAKGTGAHVFSGQAQMPNGCLLGPSNPGKSETTNFAYLSAMTAGDPTGVPSGATGYCAITYNDTDQKLWIYSTVAAKWVGVQLA